MSSNAVVEIDGVSKIFEPPPASLPFLGRGRVREPVVALRNVSLDVRRGEILGLVGPNGAGKTVLVKLIATLAVPTSGRVRVFGLDSVKDSRAIRDRLGMTTSDERSFYWRLTCRQNMLFFARLYGLGGRKADARIDELLAAVDLTHSADRAYKLLSVGNRQRLELARALLSDPPLLLLDEPTSNLDPIAAGNLRSLIAERVRANPERSILFTSHNLEEVEAVCTRIAILRAGEIVECADMEALRARFGTTEEVTLLVREPVDRALLRSLALDVPSLEWHERGASLSIEFRRRPADATFDRVTSILVGAGVHLESCRTRTSSLREIFDDAVLGVGGNVGGGGGARRAAGGGDERG